MNTNRWPDDFLGLKTKIGPSSIERPHLVGIYIYDNFDRLCPKAIQCISDANDVPLSM